MVFTPDPRTVPKSMIQRKFGIFDCRSKYDHKKHTFLHLHIPMSNTNKNIKVVPGNSKTHTRTKAEKLTNEFQRNFS